MTQIPMFGLPGPPPDKPASNQAVRLHLLVTVKAAPNPSQTFGETVCVGGLSTDPGRPGWFRLYPINFRELGPQASFHKYDVICVDAVPARHDARKESWRPLLHTLRVEGHLGGWPQRRAWLDPAVGTAPTMCRLQRGASIHSTSVALIPPARVTRLQIERHPGWTAAQQAKIDQYVAQLALYENEDRTPLRAPRFRGFYHYTCRETGCQGHRQGLLDWEFVAFQLLRLSRVDDTTAIERLQQRFHGDLCGPGREVAFYVGNMAAHPTSFIVGGVYGPPRRRSPAR